MEKKQPLLLHSCCGPCSTAVVERLTEEYDVTLFFYNPNITDAAEYENRKAAQLKFLEKYNSSRSLFEPVDFLEGRYEPHRFLKFVSGFEAEPEGGRRCAGCFELRLAETAEMARNLGFHFFGTTLSVSPHKNHALICQIGSELAAQKELCFLKEDFKKKAGFQRSIQLAKEYGLYRQDYCGCEFSKQQKGDVND